MTRRERKERKLALREQWTRKAEERAQRRFEVSKQAVEGIPVGQPILVGHHSEGRHGAALKRSDKAMRSGLEATALAKHHAEQARGIARQLDTCVFSDDPDAIEALEARIRKTEAMADRYTAINKAWRKYKGDVKAMLRDGIVSERLAETMQRTMELAPWLGKPLDATGLRTAIRRDRQRIETIRQGSEVAPED